MLNLLLHALIVFLDVCPAWLRGAVAAGSAWLAVGLTLRTAQTARCNLAACYPDLSEREVSALTRAVLRHAVLLVFDTATAWLRDPQSVLTMIDRVEGEAAVEAARQGGRPVVFVLPHLGNWELINHYLGTRYGLTHMYQAARRPWLDRFVQSRRARTGTRFVPADRSGVRAQIEALRAGGCIGTMADQEPTVHDGTFAPYFGHACWTGTLAPTLARKADAAVFVSWCEREAGGRYRIRFMALETAPSPASFNALIEAAVRQSPAQYVWTYKRFRTRPPGQPAFYPLPKVAFGAARVYAARVATRFAGALPLRVLHGLARAGAAILWRLGTRFRRQSLVNTEICISDRYPTWRDIARASWNGTTANLANTAVLWKSEATELERMGGEAIFRGLSRAPRQTGARGTLLLAPRLGHRELLIRVAGERFDVSEIYQPFPRPTVDALIREQRAASGIRLLGYTRAGFDTAIQRLRAGEYVIVCPEQQPRLGDGEFINFFGEPALVAADLARLVHEGQCRVLLAWAEPLADSWDVTVEELSFDDDGQVLAVCNAALERSILAAPARFRWHDKRFNIRPRGARRVY